MLFNYECLRCNKRSDSNMRERLKCGDCLYDRVEIVEMKLVGITLDDGVRLIVVEEVAPS